MSDTARDDDLLKVKTASYQPSAVGLSPSWAGPGGAFGALGRFALCLIDQMRQDEHVELCLSWLKTPVEEAEVEVWSPDAREQAFAAEAVQKFWGGSLDVALEDQPYGRVAAEAVYEDEDGLTKFSHLRAIHPRDARPWTHEGKLVFVRWEQGGSFLDPGDFGRAPADDDRRLLAATPDRPAKGTWWVHGTTYSHWYGRSVLFPCWWAWRAKTQPDAALESLLKWLYKWGVTPSVIRHPDVEYQSGPGATPVPAADFARQMMAELKAAGILALSSATDEHGNYLWRVEEWSEQKGRAEDLVDPVEFLNKMISRGCGIPDEVLTYQGEGSQGRASVAMRAFFASRRKVARRKLEDFDTQVLRPLSRLNGFPGRYRLRVRKQEEAAPPAGPQGGTPGAPRPAGRETDGPRFGAMSAAAHRRGPAVVTADGVYPAVRPPWSRGVSLSFNPDQARDDGGRWAEAAGVMAAAHPHPGEGPELPAGIANPKKMAESPALRAAAAAYDEHTDRFNRHMVAATARRMLAEPHRLTPLPPEGAGRGPRLSRFRRALDEVNGAAGDTITLGPAYARHRRDVAASHEHGPAALEAARAEAARRYEAAVRNAEGHLAGLPEDQRGKGRKHLDRAMAGGPLAGRRRVSMSQGGGQGAWVTIGGHRGEDGKRHGGTPVYVEGGRITKGAPALAGKKIAALEEGGGDGTHRQQLHREKQYQRAAWAKRARKEGVKPAHLHQLAAEMIEHDKESKADLREMLSRAKDELSDSGRGYDARALTTNLRSGRVEDEIPGLDVVAESMARQYPHLFHGSEDGAGGSEARLIDYLTAGNPEVMTEDEAYGAALDHLAEEAGRRRDESFDEPVPFSAAGRPTAEAAFYLALREEARALRRGVRLSMDDSGLWHGPVSPGEGWVEITPGPQGGKRWAKRPRPAPAAKPPPVTVAVAPGASAAVAGEVADALRQVPSRVQNALEARGVSVKVTRRVLDERPHLAGLQPRGWPAGTTHENLDGCYDGGEVIVAEMRVDPATGQEVRNGRVPGVVRHELGHAADEAYGNFSHDPAFLAAYNADVADIRANAVPVDPYYLQPGEAGPEEVFAEAFAQTYGGGTDGVTPNFLAAFRRAAQAMRDKLR